MKRIATLAVALAILAGCGDKAEKQANTVAATSTPTEAPAATTQPPRTTTTDPQGLNDLGRRYVDDLRSQDPWFETMSDMELVDYGSSICAKFLEDGVDATQDAFANQIAEESWTEEDIRILGKLMWTSATYLCPEVL